MEIYLFIGALDMKITVQLASVPDRDNLVAELWDENEQWGEVSQETENLRLEIYPRTSGENGNVWSFDLTEIIEKLKEAQKRISQLDLKLE
jgi:hypothetical protein